MYPPAILEGFNTVAIVDFLRSLDHGSQKAYARTMSFYMSECQFHELNPTHPSTVKEFAKLRHEEGLKTSTIRTEISKIVSMFLFGLQIEVYKDVPTIQRESSQWEKNDTTKKSDVESILNLCYSWDDCSMSI